MLDNARWESMSELKELLESVGHLAVAVLACMHGG